ncbi:inositol monophosphatase family protein [Nesterenkonia lutea]|uniref:Inositol-1-monophosphatase n=1 Tax=Nesterenkonia lutea TaxID=272919 RepID=A0ABR9JB23_9MICC|nr:inositol monophosphatase family protein [Nesterenkonia lutea]MBE1523131.1 myo-inositol-1(or 4)-monophosphatase [Nesterenkonia lutea]
MNAQKLQDLLEIAHEAAAAGAAVLAEREEVSPSGLILGQEQSGVETKSSASDLVTDFDRRAEQAVREVINRRRPDDEVSGEEYGTTTPQEPSGHRWSIDPLDGTTNFVRGIVYYGTSVGLQGPDGNWLAGVVVAPALGRIWWASRGQGAFSTNRDSEPVRLSGPTGDLAAGLLSTGYGYDPARRAEQTRAVAAMLPAFGNMRRLGAAALDICMVADGTQDAYAEYGIWEHDWAAAALIAEESGVPVHRPAAADSSVSPDWCVIGDIGMELSELSPAPLAR